MSAALAALLLVACRHGCTWRGIPGPGWVLILAAIVVAILVLGRAGLGLWDFIVDRRRRRYR